MIPSRFWGTWGEVGSVGQCRQHVPSIERSRGSSVFVPQNLPRRIDGTRLLVVSTSFRWTLFQVSGCRHITRVQTAHACSIATQRNPTLCHHRKKMCHPRAATSLRPKSTTIWRSVKELQLSIRFKLVVDHKLQNVRPSPVPQSNSRICVSPYDHILDVAWASSCTGR